MVAGGKVVVQTTNRVAVTKAITVRSVNGPSVTIIRGAFHPATTNGNAAVRCAFVTNGATLIGFTLTNGATRSVTDAYGGGVACTTNGVVSNCVITGNSAACGGGAYKGTLLDCTITNNTADYGGGAYESVLNRCTLTGNGAGGGEGGGTYYGTLSHCTLSGNSAWNGGGGVNRGYQLNCTIVGNSAGQGGGAYESVRCNSIIYYNTPTNVEAGSTTAFCCVTPLPGTYGNITNAPMFVDTNDWSDLHLAPGSPCVNAGTNAFVTAAADFDGLPRIIGGTVDMGVYESTNGVTSHEVPWGWLLQYGWAADGSDDLDDPDGDGFLVWMRYVAGTDPTNSASRFKVVAVSNAPQSRVFFLPDLVGRVYTLEYADDLSTGIWTPVPGQYRVPGTGPGQYLIDFNSGARARFYRVHVALP